MSDDSELQSTVARVLDSEPEPGGIGDLHADIAVLRSRLAEAVVLLRSFIERRSGGSTLGIEKVRRAAAFIAELEREAGK